MKTLIAILAGIGLSIVIFTTARGSIDAESMPQFIFVSCMNPTGVLIVNGMFERQHVRHEESQVEVYDKEGKRWVKYLNMPCSLHPVDAIVKSGRML